MIHPLLRLFATQPHLVGDHMEAYADLVGDELKRTGTVWSMRIGLYVVAVCLLGVGLVLTGVALMLWGALPLSGSPAPWLLIVVPVVPFAGSIVCYLVARRPPVEGAFDKIKRQLSADMAVLREVSA